MWLRARAWHVGVFRASVALVVLVSPEPDMAAAIARGPAALRFYPGALARLAHVVPVTEGTTSAARAVFYASGALSLLGLFTRPALVAFVCATLYLFGVAQLTGEVVHDMHLVWMLALLAACRAGDGFSLDAWFARRRLLGPPRGDVSYDVVLGAARVLLGIVYFFPGFWKLKTSGLVWITGPNVVNQMHWKWAQWGGYRPPVRVDEVPWLVSLGAAGVVAFELGFGLVALVPRWRRALAVVGFAFHQATRVFFLITFTSLWACYACLLLPKVRPIGRGRAFSRKTAGVWLVAAGLVLGATVEGARGRTQSYPFACYPTFEHVVGPEMPDIGLEIERADGGRLVLPPVPRSQAEWGRTWQVAGLFGVTPRRETLLAFVREDLARSPVVPAPEVIHVRLVYRSVEPGSKSFRVARELAVVSRREL